MNRTCGTCSACCTRLPIKEIAKPANTRCAHQPHAHGCKIYRKDGFPTACRYWTCRWLSDPDTRDLSRPDRAGYVIDVMIDYITIRDDDTGATQNVGCIQVWCDPKRPDSHRDPRLREYLERRADEGMCAVIRYSASEAFVLFAPIFTGGRGWQEMHSAMRSEEHTAADIAAALGPDFVAIDLSKEQHA